MLDINKLRTDHFGSERIELFYFSLISLTYFCLFLLSQFKRYSALLFFKAYSI